MGILGILGVILSAITSFLFTSPLPHLNLTFHILLYIYCFEPANISSVMTDEIFAGSKQYIYRRIWKVRLRWGKGEVKRNDVMALKMTPKIPKIPMMILK